MDKEKTPEEQLASEPGEGAERENWDIKGLEKNESLDLPEGGAESAMIKSQERVRELKRSIEVVKADFERTNAQIAKLKEELGLPPASPNEQLKQRIADMQTRLEASEKSLDLDERRYLDVPEGEMGELDGFTSPEQDGSDLERAPEGTDEEKMRELREEIVSEYIRLHTERVLEELREQVPGAENQEKAEQLTVLKIEDSVREVLENYVRTGEFVKITWAVKWHGATIKTKDGDAMFVTKVEMDMSSSNNVGDLRTIDEAMNSREKATFEKQEENGNLKKETVEGKGS